ncbi:MAG: hypothetical protein KDC09_08490 [Bacteroidales bacterium]|nr:hypothetical protein [Bacteroidales bacterium]
MKKRFVPIFYLLAFLSLVSCYPEYKLAHTFIKSDKDISVMVLPTYVVFKDNLKTGEVKGLKKMSETEADSALLANSIFLKDISDSIFLERFTNSFLIELEALGIKVYNESYADSFLYLPSEAYIINVAQILLEEHYNRHEDKETIGEYEYFKTVDQNALTYNFWFEFTQVRNEKTPPKLFYTSETINDLVNGYFVENPFTGSVKYKYSVSEIDLDIIYEYAEILGQRYAGYFYDYLMNGFIYYNWTQKREPYFWMHYKRYNNTLDPDDDARFMEME